MTSEPMAAEATPLRPYSSGFVKRVPGHARPGWLEGPGSRAKSGLTELFFT
jgi:hypothetical protein